jgi:outer membrane protein W
MVVAALAILPAAAANAQFQAGDWELTLSGQGSNGPDFDGTQFSVNANIGYFLTKELEISVRQLVGYSDIGGAGGDGSNLAYGTTVALDYHFDLGKFQPYVGGNIGYRYGDVNNTFVAGPEAGVKYFVNSTTFVQFNVNYQFFFDNDTEDASDAFSDGQFLYSLGIGFRWH